MKIITYVHVTVMLSSMDILVNTRSTYESITEIKFNIYLFDYCFTPNSRIFKYICGGIVVGGNRAVPRGNPPLSTGRWKTFPRTVGE